MRRESKVPVVMILHEKVTKARLEELIEGTQIEMETLYRFQQIDEKSMKNLILLFYLIKQAGIEERPVDILDKKV